MRFAAKSDKGMMRDINEDSYDIVAGLPGLPAAFIIADGMGGHNSGEVASRMAVEFAREFISENFEDMAKTQSLPSIIEKVMQEANRNVYRNAKENDSNHGMGTTFIIAIADGDKLHIGHVGDSRVYLIRNGAIEKVTTDHSYVEELVKNGSLTREEATNHPGRNVITRALGCDEELKTDAYSCDILKNDYYVLCTDGLSNMLDDEEIKAVVEKFSEPEKICSELVGRANQRGGEDNITVIVINND